MSSGLDPRALRDAREGAGLTQHQLARLVGVAGGERISRWELGASQPRPDLLVRLAGILSLRPMQLVRFDSDVADLRALRLAAGLDANDVVALVHTSLPTYRKWEQGRWGRMPEQTTLDLLARAFKVRRVEVVGAFYAAKALRGERAAERR